MIEVALGCVLLALFLWASSNGRRVLRRREWRLLSGAVALASFTGAAYAGVRGAWEATIVLVVMGLWLASTARQKGGGAASLASRDQMSLAEARSILGVAPDVGRKDIQAAYLRLMRMAHPDKGGTSGLAAQLTAARDRLLKG
jgi:hypothetical protein